MESYGYGRAELSADMASSWHRGEEGRSESVLLSAAQKNWGRLCCTLPGATEESRERNL
jgi:hypothetical protein